MDIHESVSRTMPDVVSPTHLSAAQRLKAVTYTYREAEDMINIGAYKKGSSTDIDYAIAMREPTDAFRRQAIHVGRLQNGVHEAQLIVALVVGQDEYHVHRFGCPCRRYEEGGEQNEN